MNYPRTTRIVIALALILPTIITLPYFVLLSGESTELRQLSYGIGKIVQFLLPIVWMHFILRERFPLALPQRNIWLLVSVLLGCAITALMFGLYAAVFSGSELMITLLPAVHEKIVGMGLTSLSRYVLFAVFYVVIHSFLEEYYWRWFVFGLLERIAPFPWAMAISSVGFMAHHVVILSVYFGITSFFTLLFSVSIAIGGMLWAFLYRKSDSIFVPWISHAFVDATIFGIGYSIVHPLFS